MKVILEPKALEFIKSNGEDSVEAWLEGCSSWGTSEPKPSVKMGKPKDLEEYDKYEVDGIDIYVRADVITKNDELKINHSKLLWNEKLTVEGMEF